MDDFDSAAVTGLVWRRVTPGNESQVEAIMRQIMLLARGSEGFLGSEIFPPIPGVQDAYVVIYRFDRGETLRKWLASARRGDLLGRIEGLLVEPAREFYFAHGRRPAGSASSVFAYRIRLDRETEFRDWRRRIQDEARGWKGFLGTESFDTLDSESPEFVVVVRFDNRANMDAWLKSDIRKSDMAEVKNFVEQFTLRRIGSGFEGWFDTSENIVPPAPWRQMLVILSALFPVIMILRQVLSPLFAVLPMPAAFLILLVADLSVLTYVVMPRFTRLMDFWLRPRADATWRSECAGLGVLLGVIAGTLAACLLAGV